MKYLSVFSLKFLKRTQNNTSSEYVKDKIAYFYGKTKTAYKFTKNMKNRVVFIMGVTSSISKALAQDSATVLNKQL